jgi:acyl carrier protein
MMNGPDTITTRIHEWITGNFPLAQQREVGLHDSLLGGGIIDSLGTLEVVRFLEEDLGVQVTDDEMLADHFESIHAIAQFVESKLQEQNVNAEAV